MSTVVPSTSKETVPERGGISYRIKGDCYDMTVAEERLHAVLRGLASRIYYSRFLFLNMIYGL
jgi:hypothetical protein